MDSAAIPSVDPPLVRPAASALNAPISTLFAALPPWWKERRKVIRITRENGRVTSEVVKDYDQLYKEEEAAVQHALLELADGDDNPQAQEYLMQAWTSMAMYLANADDEDKAQAVQVLQMIGNMINEPADGSTNPTIPTAFNASRRAEKSALAKCPQCGRSFATTDGLANHMKTVHTKSGDGSTPTPPGKK